MDTKQTIPQTSYEERFVNTLIKRIQQDKGLAAQLRHADNPSTEYQSWEFLAGFGVDLEHENERLPFATVAAAIAKAKADNNGTMRLGRAIAACYEEKNDQAKAKLRRILACDDLPELCRNLRPVLTLIDSRIGQPLDYVRLLQQLRRFVFNPQRIKAQWAQEFYGSAHEEKEEA